MVVHSVLRGERDGLRGLTKRLLATLAYGISGVALVLHAADAVMGEAVPSPLGMRLLTYTFVALVVPLAAVTRGQSGSRRALWAAALAIFAVSALHLSQLHQGDAAWPIELMGHHASLPLAVCDPVSRLSVRAGRSLPQARAFVAHDRRGRLRGHRDIRRSFRNVRPVRQFPGQVAILVTVWVATVLLYPTMRRAIVWIVDTVVLRRPDYRALRTSIARKTQAQHEVPGLLYGRVPNPCAGPERSCVTWREWRPRAADELLVLGGHGA